MSRVLVIEDHAEMGELIVTLFREEGHEAIRAATLKEARAQIRDKEPELITLDLNLPDGSGLAFCAELRGQSIVTPIIMLTSEISAESVARGLEAGASDYLKKPIDPVELRARLRGHLRRQAAAGLDVEELEFHGLRLDLLRRKAFYRKKEIRLSGRQLDILAALMIRPEAVITREAVIERLGEGGLEMVDRTIDSHVSQLRKKLKEAGVASVFVSPVYGVGYRLEAARPGASSQ